MPTQPGNQDLLLCYNNLHKLRNGKEQHHYVFKDHVTGPTSEMWQFHKPTLSGERGSHKRQ